MLRPPPVLSGGANNRDEFGQFEAHFAFDDLTQRDVRSAEVFNASDHGPALATSTRIQLTNTL
jgi:hypothetical protein